MLGVIAGDIIGSRFEWKPIKTTAFELFHPHSCFTDDTVLTVATAWAILRGRPYGECYLDFGRRYMDAGYGRNFLEWLTSANPQPYDSWGNGSAMRVAPVGFAFDDETVVLREAARSAAPTHNHPEGIKGAQATALGIFMARGGASKDEIRTEVASRFGYDLSRSTDQIRPTYGFDVSCGGTVPQALVCFHESTDFESAIRLAVSLGGDSDTLGAITGGVAQAYYGGIPPYIDGPVRARLPADLLEVVEEFERRYALRRNGP